MPNAIGVITSLPVEGPILAEVRDFGLKACQLSCWNLKAYTEDRVRVLRQELAETRIEVTSLWAGWPGPAVWDFVDGPRTLGIVPRRYRRRRVAALKQAADFAQATGIPAVVTHLGFIPENAADPAFAGVVETVKDVAVYCKERGLEFWFETGQETPVTMLRLITQVGTGNLGVNLDPANLILYGRASPVDSLDVFGSLVRGVHAKDGVYPTDPMKLGHEVKVGEGKVRFPELVRDLSALQYAGAYIIEREIRGDQQKRDIADTIRYLEGLLKVT